MENGGKICLRKFFSYYKPYKGLFILDFSCAVVAGLLELGFPLIVNQFIDKLLPGQNWTLILWACFGLLASLYVKCRLTICRYILGTYAWC